MDVANKTCCCLCDMGYVKLPKVLELIPVCEASWWNGCKTGLYPKPYKIGQRSKGWKIKELYECMESFEKLD